MKQELKHKSIKEYSKNRALKVTNLIKGECLLLFNDNHIPEAKINPYTERLNRPTIALIQGSKNTPYEIKLHEEYGLSCDCPSWIHNQRGNRTCKHTEQVKQKLKVII
jgi:hypothetical protein